MPEELPALSDEPWTASLSASRALTRYNAPNQTVDPDITRYDHEWRLNSLLAVPVVESRSMVLNLSRVWMDSKLPNYAYGNKIASLGASKRF